MYRVLLFLISIYGSIHGNAVSHFPNKGDVPRQYHPRFLMYEEPHNIEFKYHNYDQMSRFLRATSLRFQNLTALYSIGKSVKGTTFCVCVCVYTKELTVNILFDDKREKGRGLGEEREPQYLIERSVV